MKGVMAKNLQAALFFVDFTKAFNSVYRGKMEKRSGIFHPVSETIALIIML